MNKTKVKMIRQAFTLRDIPAREDVAAVAAFKDSKHPQRPAVETDPPGILLVRLQFRKCGGFVSNIGVRDFNKASEMALDPGAIASS